LLFLPSNKKTVVVAQLVRASDCDSEGRGFEPPRLPTVRGQNRHRCFSPLSFESFSILNIRFTVCLQD
jgi:hypothetical protein